MKKEDENKEWYTTIIIPSGGKILIIGTPKKNEQTL